MKSIFILSALATTTSFTPLKQAHKCTTDLAASEDELAAFATKCNPCINFYDPINLSKGDFWNQGSDYTISWLRQSEIKHSRVAMAAFVGYCVQSNFVFPWPQHLDGTGAPSADLNPEQQWDAIPEVAKWQIFGLIALLEVWDETGGGTLQHYTKGRKAGQFPSLQLFRENVHFCLDLYDPFGFSKNRSEEDKARGLAVETNNGRLAMLGIFGFLAADKVPGSVPGLVGIATPYDGNIMIPFEGNFELDAFHLM
eukprot:CAMPEP_0194147170 /NCGR_PEP_ID=MMETSP0152-20130528/22562_1 /TAXON_ID=1049557 /ORGANISM="Thalassiothrix antarctica, Strain L6-D1" /LENGTH=253 /DNA_ID=CAMNT_0038847871 /DNA_START=66 /DNA_END=827 /DNA_ORIENTATION=-